MIAITIAVSIASAVFGTVPGLSVDQLVGRWEGDGFVVVLDAGGKGSMSDGPEVPAEPLRWSVKGDRLLVTQDGEAESYAVALTGDTLKVSGGDLVQSLRLKRASGGSKKTTAAANVADQAPAKASTNSNAATCDGACEHILACVGVRDVREQKSCVKNCRQKKPDAKGLAAFTAADCATALKMLQGGGSGQGNSGHVARSKECQGCVRDGNHCVWLSQGNWGSGWASPYSGAASDCDPRCCGL